ncbi:hypothetical protein XH80_04545 [Bradyrhizobium sp. CCBAU 45384]|nr:hypothetical protein [Bradyrhizobium sp. CCBAU 45384]
MASFLAPVELEGDGHLTSLFGEPPINAEMRRHILSEFGIARLLRTAGLCATERSFDCTLVRLMPSAR